MKPKWMQWTVLGLAVLAMAPVWAQEAAETEKRTPAPMLRPEQAGILLMETRVALEQPDKTLDFMGLRDGDIVADIGCGNGWYSLRVAERIAPHGLVLAVDVQQGMLDQLVERQREAGIRNVHPILGEFTDPLLPPGKVDWILLVDAYHEFSDPEPMLARMKESLAPGGRVALLEYRAEQDPATIPFPIPRNHKMTIDEVMSEWVPAGFELVTLVQFLPAQHLFVFKKAGDDTRRPIRDLEVGQTNNVSTYDNTVYFAAQPDAASLETFASYGVKTIVNLRSAEEMAGVGFDEAAKAEELGMRYVHAPMGRELPPDATLEEIFAALDSAAAEGPVLLHCASSNRVGAVWGLYAGKRAGLDADEAIAEGKAAGMTAPAFEEELRETLSDEN
jgi:uncharacterized protein (TIGR01244 family)